MDLQGVLLSLMLTYITKDIDAGSPRAPLNPERGFMVETSSFASNFQPLTVAELEGYRNMHHVTMIRRMVVLDSFLNSSLTEDFLLLLVKDFEAADNAGFTMILRFHYNDNNAGTCCPPVDITDADIDTAEHHVEQLGRALHAWQHVVVAVEAGFIGVWGEWYYSQNYNNPTTWEPSQSHLDKRRRLVEALLAAFSSHQILLRYVPVIQAFLGDNLHLTPDQGFDGSRRSRLGLHNDCFLASDKDFGTFSWENPEADRIWLEKQSNFTFVGGETCRVNTPRTDCPSALADLERYHWTYLNIYYNRDVLDPWQEQGCYDTIADNLGYRLVIDYPASVFPTSIARDDSKYVARIVVKNIGMGRIINNKSLSIIFIRNEVRNVFPITGPSSDLRKAGAGETIEVLIDIELGGLETGEYTAALVVEGEGSSVWRRVVLEPYQENEERWNFLPGFVLEE